jgi:hypothetical protein
MPDLIVPLLSPDLILRISIKDLFFFLSPQCCFRAIRWEGVVRESYLSGVVLARS